MMNLRSNSPRQRLMSKRAALKAPKAGYPKDRTPILSIRKPPDPD